MSKTRRTAAEHRLASQVGAHRSWANTPDRRARTAPGTAAFLDRFDREVDPLGKLPPGERAKRAENARAAYFASLALKSAQARRAKAAARTARPSTGAAEFVKEDS